ncbi:MAG: hypothetical protein QOJ42_3426 [Acidobacteriaceae bacterium]|nr:hypothetical protein [Acidobacteriaceae bacterium]
MLTGQILYALSQTDLRQLGWAAARLGSTPADDEFVVGRRTKTTY